MGKMFRCAAVFIALGLAASFAPAQREFRSATRFDPPAESFHAPDSLRVLEDQPGTLSQEEADQLADEAKHRTRKSRRK